MGVSFKVSKAGKRYRPKLSQLSDTLPDDRDDTRDDKPPIRTDDPASISHKQTQAAAVGLGDDIAEFLFQSSNSGGHSVSRESEASFSLFLFPDGFSIGKPAEGMLLPLLQDVPELLHPYDRASEALFSAIEYGWLPADIFDDIPCKYNNGIILCEVWDYRNSMPKSESTVSSGEKFPIVQKVQLRMGMENVVKDMPSISDDSWTYSDLLEVESRILKAVQPELCLDPNPLLDRLCGAPGSKMINLGICRLRHRKKENNVPAINNTSDTLSQMPISQMPIISSNMALENPESHACLAVDGSVPCAPHTILSSMRNVQHCIVGLEALRHGLPLVSEPNNQLAASGSRSVPTTTTISEQEFTDFYTDLRNPGTLLGKRDNYEAQLTSKSTILKKPKQEQLDLAQKQLIRSQTGTVATDLQRKNALLQQQLDAERVRLLRFGSLKHPQVMMVNDSPQAVVEGVPKLDGKMSAGRHCCVKNELAEITKSQKPEVEKNINGHHRLVIGSNQSNQLQSQLQHILPLMQAQLPPTQQWDIPGHPVEKDMNKDDASQERKFLQNPQVSAASSRSQETSGFSLGAPYSTHPPASVVGLHKEKVTSMSANTIGTAINSCHNDSLLRENHASQPSKRKSSSLPKTPNMNRAGSPANVSNVNAAFSASSPLVGTEPVQLPSVAKGDPAIERFLKIDLLTQRYQLNYKKLRVDEYPERKPVTYSPQKIAEFLSSPDGSVDFKDNTMPMSKCLLGGSINVCKTRILTFKRSAHIYQGNGIRAIVRESQSKLVMSEKPTDRMVEVRIMYEDEEGTDPSAVLQCGLPTLPNTHYADLFAAQYISLMGHEGYQLSNDQVQPISFCNIGASSSQPAIPLPGAAPPELPHLTPISGQSMNAVSAFNSSTSTQNLQKLHAPIISTGAHMLPPDNIQGLQMSSSCQSRSKQMDPAVHLSAMGQQQHQHSQMDPAVHLSAMGQQQHQHSQIQRSLLSGNNLLGNSTSLPMGTQVANSSAHLQFQLHQRQLLQQSIMQRKMMAVGLGPTTCVGNAGMMQSIGGLPALGNMVGLGSMGHVVGMGGTRSGPMGGQVPGLSNLYQIGNLNQVSGSGNITQQVRVAAITPAQAAALEKMRLQQARGRGMPSGGQIRNSIDGVGGKAGSGSLHGVPSSHMSGRASMIQLQRAAMASMGPPRGSSIDVYMNSQQQQQIQQQLQLLSQQQQQMGSPLQQMGSPLQQMGSPLLSPQMSSMTEQVGSPMSHVSSQQMSQQVPMSPQQLSSGACPPQQASAGNVVVGPGSPQLSSQTHGSVGSITSSSLSFRM